MRIESERVPPWLATVLLAEDDTEESVMGSDWHQKAIFEAHGSLLSYAEDQTTAGGPPWYVSSQVTVIVDLPRRQRPWQPKPDLFVVVGAPAIDRTSYDTRRDGPMPHFILEVTSESTWRDDIANKRDLYALAGVQEYVTFDPTGAFLPEQIRAWRAGAKGFERWQPLRRSDGTEVWRSAVLSLDLRLAGPLLRFDDPVRGPILFRREIRQRWLNAEQARDAEHVAREAAEQARNTAEERARAAEQELTALRQQLDALKIDRSRPPRGQPDGD
jgi:Uma2 family endonuclease